MGVTSNPLRLVEVSIEEPKKKKKKEQAMRLSIAASRRQVSRNAHERAKGEHDSLGGRREVEMGMDICKEI